MGKVINCECGEVVRAASDDELVRRSSATSARRTLSWSGS